jgi:cell division protein FtsW
VFLFPPRKGATRWITLFGLNFQPSELAKLVAVVFSAAVLERRMHRIDDVKWALGPIVIVAGGMAALVVAQKDIGTPLVLVLAVTSIMVSAGLAWRHLAGLTLVLLPVIAGLIAMSPHRMKRVMSFMDPTADLTAAGYQLWQSKIALGVGGIFGVGLGNGMQKLSFLP